MGLKFFENDQERWDALSKLRYDVACYIKIKPGSRILDVLVGYADFSRAIAKRYDTKVTAIEIAIRTSRRQTKGLERKDFRERSKSSRWTQQK